MQQKPVELIHARNLISALSTPAFLVDRDGRIVFFNESAGGMLGRQFEETGPISTDEWRTRMGPLDERGEAMDLEAMPVTRALRRGSPGYARHELRPAASGEPREFEITGIPIVATGGGFRGAILFLWASEGRTEAEEEQG